MAQQRGDTLIEVLVSIVVLSMVIVGSTTIMSRGLRATQVATEHTQVSLQVNQQAEMLRYVRDGYVKDSTSALGVDWSNIITNYANVTPSTYVSCGVSSGKNPFYLDPIDLVNIVKNYSPAVLPLTSAVGGKGLWVEATNSNGAVPAYTDFQIRACWAGPGGSGQQQTISTLRLYDPSK